MRFKATKDVAELAGGSTVGRLRQSSCVISRALYTVENVPVVSVYRLPDTEEMGGRLRTFAKPVQQTIVT